LTTIRSVDQNGEPAPFSGAPERAPKKLRPWFHPRAKNSKSPLFVFGHWAALGLRCEKNWISLDSGCVWGRSLSAVRLDDRKVFQVQSHRKDRGR
jgi:bis(5'-nucleosyl)-tetraphosphatase (symmetrical)